ncbi:MAG: hypothetical protein IJV17_00690 [Prevotella sp.]|nr:hypothetical protein [Prevotella sp.]
MIKKIICVLCLLSVQLTYGKVVVKNVTPQTTYASTLLKGQEGKLSVSIEIASTGEAEGFTLIHKGKKVRVIGNDNAGAIYGVNKLLELLREDPQLERLTAISEVPQMKLRGACVGLQKTVYLPGHRVYEYPYTPENFPWFYDKALWLKYLDLLAENNMNTVYLWNGHPFASLVKLKDYPFAPEVDDATMQKNQEMFGFLVDEADRRGIRVIQMFYNIILSKPFADHYGLKTQDRNRPITPLIADYTRKSIAAFVEKYPKVGFLICLGEAMSGIDNDIKWMTETVIPGIKDGLKASGRTDTPPIILRNHDTDGPAVLKASLPLYPNIYTMNKYTGESLTTYEPGGPWGDTHRMLAAAAPIHIDNVHILANLEPWRWSSPAFTQKAVQAMHRVHHSKGLHLYPQASYWDWPFTADKLPDGERLLQIDRDWMWYKVWGRYAWNSERREDRSYWKRQLSDYFGIDTIAADALITAYDEAGEIAPKLLRRFGITEGNRQTLLLGMTMGELVNPYKYTIYPGFYESCGPEGEKLIEYVEKEWKGEQHVGELPLDIVDQCMQHGIKAENAISRITAMPTRHADEFERVRQDMKYYQMFAAAFYWKVKAAQRVLNYKWTHELKYLEDAVPCLEQSQNWWNALSLATHDTYLYANSMQTSQRRIPVGGDDGKMKTWSELSVVYQAELDALKENIEKLKNPMHKTNEHILPAQPANVKLFSKNMQLITLQKGAIVFENRPDTPVDSVAPELEGMQALVLNRDTTRIVGTTIEFESDKPVKLLVGLFKDDDPKWAKAPKLEIDATGNEYGQAEPLLTNAISIVQMPKVNIHQYTLPAGRQTLHLPKGILMVAGFTTSNIKPRDCGLNGPSGEVDWLFQK